MGITRALETVLGLALLPWTAPLSYAAEIYARTHPLEADPVVARMLALLEEDLAPTP